MSLEYTEVGGVISNVKIKIGLTDFEISEISRFVDESVVTGDDLLVCQNYLGLTPAQKDTLKTGIYKYGNGQTYDMNEYGDFKYQYYHPKHNAWYKDRVYSYLESDLVTGRIFTGDYSQLVPTQSLIQPTVTAPGNFIKQADFAGIDTIVRLFEEFDSFCKQSQALIKPNLKFVDQPGVTLSEDLKNYLIIQTARFYDKFN